MAGTLLAKLSSIHQVDNTAMSAGNAGYSSAPAGSPGSGNTAIHLDAAKMAGSEGYRLTQSAGNAVTNCFYLDAPSAVTKMSIRAEFNYSTSPTAASTILRGFADTNHASTVWSLQLTTANKLNFVEAGTGGLSVVSSTALSPGTDYILQMLLNTDSDQLTCNVLLRGTNTIAASVSGTISTSVAMQSVRWGIGTASSLAQIDTNDNFAIGSTDLLTRTDFAAPALGVTGVLSGPRTSGQSDTLTLTGSGGNANPYTYQCVWDGTTMGPQTSGVFTKTEGAAKSGASITFDVLQDA